MNGIVFTSIEPAFSRCPKCDSGQTRSVLKLGEDNYRTECMACSYSEPSKVTHPDIMPGWTT